MTAFLTRRLGQSAIVLVGVTLMVFIVIHLLPGGPAAALLGDRATPARIHAFIIENGYNRPLWVQYVTYMEHLLQGNLGYSYAYNQSVGSLLAQALPRTAILVGVAVALALLVAVPMGLLQAIYRNRMIDHALTSVAFLGYSLPTFWLGIVLIVIFAINLGWLPAEGPQAGALQNPLALVLPVATLTIVTVAQFSRYVRSAAIENLVQEYVRTARAKGVPQRTIIRHHVLRNSLLPIITLLGLSLPSIVAGAIIVESLFNYPGMGLLFWKASTEHDYPLLMGFTVIIGLATVLGSLLADVGYGLADPRIRAGRS